MTDRQAKYYFFERRRLAFVRARKVMAEGLHELGTRLAYRSTVACVIMDDLGVKDRDLRNKIAERILQRIFDFDA